MTDQYHVFLSYSRNDLEAAAMLRRQLEQHGLAVFKDDQSIREGDLWLDRLQQAVDGCSHFVVLVGRDGVRRWIGAETQVALIRHFGPHDDAKRLPIFPILLGDTRPETLPAFLRLFQATTWNGTDPLPERLIEQIREKKSASSEIHFEGCPFVGLDAFRLDQAQLFFGRQKETLDALACFDTRRGFPTVRWLEINGNSGSGKSSLMNAGLLPLVDQGWLWPRTSFEHWRRIGPMMPGEHPVVMLAEHLARTFGAEMAEVRRRLETDGDRALADWLRGRKPGDQTAFLLAIDQFEELFTFADPAERKSFDRLLAAALADNDCPLFLISTVRADFLDRFEELPRLIDLRNRLCKPWTLPPIGADGLREVIGGPARLAHLDVSEVQAAMVAEARDEPGALPLVENALQWLWEKREDNRLSGKLFNQEGGLAGILSEGADDVLRCLAHEDAAVKSLGVWAALMRLKWVQRLVVRLGRLCPHRGRAGSALELLFRLVNLDPEGRRHTRRRITLTEAIEAGGGGDPGKDLVYRLAGGRDPAKAEQSLRLITITDDQPCGDPTSSQAQVVAQAEKAPSAVTRPGHAPARQRKQELWVNLIHETLIRGKGVDEKGVPLGYWPTLWNYIEANKDRAMRRERLELQAREWAGRRGLARLVGLAGWRDLWHFQRLRISRQSDAGRFLAWSRRKAALQLLLLTALAAFVGESYLWTRSNDLPLDSMVMQQRFRLGYAPLPDLVPISPGKFDMGEQDEGFLKRVSKESWQYLGVPGKPIVIEKSFFMGKYEVTYEEFDYYVWEQQRAGRSDPKYPLTAKGGRGRRPVVNVDWDEASAYASWLGKRKNLDCRLPTEAEWEYAARAGSHTAYPWGDEVRRTGGGKEEFMANCRGCGSPWDGERSAPVGQFPANDFGLYDTSGNVWEWTCSSWSEKFDGNEGRCAEDQASDQRVLRGGSWGGSPDGARSAARSGDLPDLRHDSFGFRVLCSSPIR